MAGSRNSIHLVNEPEAFDSELRQAGSKLVVVHFHADSSAPSKEMIPACQALAEADDGVLFMNVDVEACRDLAARYDISVTPSFLFIRSGQLVELITGANEPRLRQLVQKLKA